MKTFNRDIKANDIIAVGTFKNEEGAVVVPQISATAAVAASSATATLDTTIAGKIVTNTGAGGAVVLTLPSAFSMRGKTFKVKATVAQVISLSPAATEGVFLAGSGVDNKDLSVAGVIGNEVTIYSNGNDYEAYYPNGVVTKEA